MKNKLLLLLLPIQLLSFNVNAQKGKDLAIAAGAGIVTGLLVANAVEDAKEHFERHMLEWVIENKNFKNKTSFELKLIKWEANKKEDLNSMSVVGFRYKEEGKDPIVLLSACQNGWINEFGVNFSKTKIYEIDKNYWSKIMTTYISIVDVGLNDGQIDVDNIKTLNDETVEVPQKLKNISNIDKKIIEFINPESKNKSMIRSHIELINIEKNKNHVVTDFDNNFKMEVFENNLNLYAKELKELMVLKRDFLVEVTKQLY